MPARDLLPLVSLSTEVAAWVAVIASVLALMKQGYDVIRNRRRERREISEALDRQPLIREQLELGNVGEAVKHLSAIIDAMGRESERYTARISHLENREQALEAEANGWEQRYHDREVEWERKFHERDAEWQARYDTLDERCRKITAVLRRHDWDVPGEA